MAKLRAAVKLQGKGLCLRLSLQRSTGIDRRALSGRFTASRLDAINRPPLDRLLPADQQEAGNLPRPVFLGFLAGAMEGDWCQLVDGTGWVLHTEVMVLGAEWERCSGIGEEQTP
ncbi:hypothetical protein UY3_11453 [Chelonia mydas]|uniref:Uncharacterized protein n=1 Tax=Chelonia mydas TaxID=8469 RepID=M7BTG7_CHEMY|nr:hypothetical protein UY3_11453 [Chelonia mydas]